MRHVLPAINVPTLVVHRVGDQPVRVGHGRYIAERIRGAKYVELPGADHMPFMGDVDALLNEVRVITSYSIHYTKLYDDLGDAVPGRMRARGLQVDGVYDTTQDPEMSPTAGYISSPSATEIVV